MCRHGQWIALGLESDLANEPHLLEGASALLELHAPVPSDGAHRDLIMDSFVLYFGAMMDEPDDQPSSPRIAARASSWAS